MSTRLTTPELMVPDAMRAKRDCSQEELATRVGLDRTYLGGVERDVRVPNLRSLIQLAAALGMRVSRLMAAVEHSAGER